mgnify:CR=1 FL=1
MVIKYKLLKDFFEFSAGTIIIIEDGYWHIESDNNGWGWNIPEFIIKNQPKWFKEIDT